VSFALEPIGHVRGGRDQPTDDDWGASRATIALDPARFGPEALAGLADFSHLEVIFVFDRVADAQVEYGARRPRGRQDWPLVGIFAQRGKNRPNRLGLCTCRIVGVEGLNVEVEGLDAIDGTPVVDLKPAMTEFQPREPLRQPAWASELMKDYW
jgi:tRNA (Thr-GGU) A37 N-methylase